MKYSHPIIPLRHYEFNLLGLKISIPVANNPNNDNNTNTNPLAQHQHNPITFKQIFEIRFESKIVIFLWTSWIQIYKVS